jgi:hypothetical protein
MKKSEMAEKAAEIAFYVTMTLAALKELLG